MAAKAAGTRARIRPSQGGSGRAYARTAIWTQIPRLRAAAGKAKFPARCAC